MCQGELVLVVRAWSTLARSASSAGVLALAMACTRGAQKGTRAAAGWTLINSWAVGCTMWAKSSAASVREARSRPRRATARGSSCGLGKPPAVRGQSRIKGARRPWGQRRHERVVTGRGSGHARGEGPPGYQRVRVRRKSHGPPRGGGGSPASPVLEVLEEVLERRETWARRESVGGVDDAS